MEDAQTGEEAMLAGTLNPVNCPLSVCEAVKEGFGRFLREFTVTDSAEAEPSQTGLSQGSGVMMALVASEAAALPVVQHILHRPAISEWEPAAAGGPAAAHVQKPSAALLLLVLRCRRPPAAGTQALRGTACHHEGAGADLPVRELRTCHAVRPGGWTGGEGGEGARHTSAGRPGVPGWVGGERPPHQVEC